MNAVYAGSFNPIHLGHMDVIKRAVKIFGSLIVVVSNNSNKDYNLNKFQRMTLVKMAIEAESLGNQVKVTVLHDNETIAEFAENNDANVIIRGVRSSSDLPFEFMMAEVNRDNNVETILLPSSPIYSNLSSSMVRECLKYKLPIDKYVPKAVIENL